MGDDVAAEPGRDPRWRRWRGPLQWLLTAAVVAFILFRIDPREAWEVVRETRPQWAAAGVALLVASDTVHVAKWQVLLRGVGVARFRDLFAVFWSSMATNNVLPFRAGDVYRVQALGTRSGLSRAGIVATLLTERVLDAVSFLLLVLIALALVASSSARDYSLGLLLGLVTMLTLGAAIAIARTDPDTPVEERRVLGRLPARTHAAVGRFLPAFVRGMRPLGELRAGSLAAAWAFGAWLLEAMAFWAFGQAFGLEVGFATYLLLMVAVNMASSLTVLPANLGVFELASIEILRAAGATPGEATAYAVGSHALVFLTISAVGIGSLGYLRASRGP